MSTVVNPNAPGTGPREVSPAPVTGRRSAKPLMSDRGPVPGALGLTTVLIAAALLSGRTR